jgi:hypothetical protein
MQHRVYADCEKYKCCQDSKLSPVHDACLVSQMADQRQRESSCAMVKIRARALQYSSLSKPSESRGDNFRIDWHAGKTAARD